MRIECRSLIDAGHARRLQPARRPQYDSGQRSNGDLGADGALHNGIIPRCSMHVRPPGTPGTRRSQSSLCCFCQVLVFTVIFDLPSCILRRGASVTSNTWHSFFRVASVSLGARRLPS